MSDTVNRDGLDYGAGWIEGLASLLNRLQFEQVQCERGESLGLKRAFKIGFKLRQDMLAQMKAATDGGEQCPERGTGDDR